jgi:hypothetical protein
MGNLYFGVFRDLEIAFQDCFLESNISFANVKLMNPLPNNSLLTNQEAKAVAFYYFLIKEKNMVPSVRALRKLKEKFLEKYKNYLEIFQIHKPYTIKGNDSEGQRIYDLIYNDEFIDINKSVLVLEEKMVSRLIIKLPGQ